MTADRCSTSPVIKRAALVFWDFDGVIKDSVEAKTAAFERLFLPFGVELAYRVRRHHEENGGVSRFEKIPLYLSWAGEKASRAQVSAFCRRFSQAVTQAVVDAPWVPGVREYLLQHYTQQYFVLLTATPQKEIEELLAVLKLADNFREVYGAPTKKINAIAGVLAQQKCLPDQALMIGDAESDLEAAQTNLVPFLLRRTPLNVSLQGNYSGPMFDDLV